MSFLEAVMGQPLIYRLWMGPFAEQKFLPILAHNDMNRVRRVLDVGCGPGTNAGHFAHADYLGVDWNPQYVENARRRYRGRFEVANAETLTVPDQDRFDFILVNSLLHHIDTPPIRRLLAHLGTLLSDDGHIHILELVLPEQASIARFLARSDRGEFPRPLESWREIFGAALEPVVFEPYSMKGCGFTLWNMVYFKGKAKTPR